MKTLVIVALLAILLVTAWLIHGRPGRGPRAITVTSDPAALAAARAEWESQRQERLAELLAAPASLHPDFPEQAILIASDRPHVIATLTQLRDDASAAPPRRVAAGIALLLLGEPGSIDQLVTIAGTDPAARERLLERLDDMVPDGEPIPPSLHPVILPALEDPRRGPWLAGVAARHRMLEAADTVTRLALQPPPAGDKWLDAAASLRPTSEIVDIALARLGPRETFGSPPGLRALINVAKATDDPALREKALGAALAHLRAQDDAPWIDGVSLTAVDAIEHLPPPAAAAGLADLALNAKWMHLRKRALASLKNVDAERAASVAKESGLSLDGAAGDGDAARPPELTPQQAAEVVVRHGLLDASAASAALAAMLEKHADETLTDDPRGFLAAAHLYTNFDVETGMSPNRHDLLILELANIAGGRFKPEAVLEKYDLESEDAETGTYSVRFIHDNRLYEFAPEDLGDWYDVEALFAALNKALEDSGRSERYVILEPDGQIAEVLFGDPAKIAAAAPELGLTLAADASGAMKQGKEFEGQILEQLERAK